MPRFSKSDLARLTRQLQDRRRVLVAEIRDQIAGDEDDHSITLRAQYDALDPHDDRALTDWVRDVAISQAERDTRELDDVTAALKRIDDGTYGECVDCGEDIPQPRLEANPSAARCIPCQERLESRVGGVRVSM